MVKMKKKGLEKHLEINTVFDRYTVRLKLTAIVAVTV